MSRDGASGRAPTPQSLWKDVIRMHRLSRVTDPSPHGPPTNPGKVARATRVGLRTSIVVLVATAFPVLSLLRASGVATSEVEDRALAGIAAIGKTASLQEQQAWSDAIRIVTSVAARPSLVAALGSHNPADARQMASRSTQSILVLGPFNDVRMYDAAGDLLAVASLPGVTPTAMAGTRSPPARLGDPVTTGAPISRQVGVPNQGVHGTLLGPLRVDV